MGDTLICDNFLSQNLTSTWFQNWGKININDKLEDQILFKIPKLYLGKKIQNKLNLFKVSPI